MLQISSGAASTKLWGQREVAGEVLAAENSIVGAGPPEAENFWKEWGQHPATTLCYGIAVGLFSRATQRGSREELYPKLLEVLAGGGHP